MDDALKGAVQMARKMEMDGAEFYGRAAQDAAGPQARRLFESFAADERRHLEIVDRLAAGLGVDVAGMPMPKDSIRTVFTDAQGASQGRAEPTEQERQAIETAQGMERESYRLYRRLADEATDAALNSLFERLSQEENQHYEMLENTRRYLSENGAWFLWDEHALLTGDMSSLGM